MQVDAGSRDFGVRWDVGVQCVIARVYVDKGICGNAIPTIGDWQGRLVGSVEGWV